MTFDEFVDSVDRAVRTRTAIAYGVYRGPAVAYWQHPGGSARLRDGVRDDVELTADEDASAPLVGPRSPATASRFADAIVSAWDPAVTAR